MRLKTKLLLLITASIFMVVLVLSAIYLTQLLRSRITQAYDNNDVIAHQILYGTRHAIEQGLRSRPVDPQNPVALRQAVAEALQQDSGLAALLNSVIRYSPTVYDVSVTDASGKVMVSSDPTTIDQDAAKGRGNFVDLKNGSIFKQFRAVFGRPRLYNLTLTLDRNGSAFAIVQVGIRTTFLRAEFEPWLKNALWLCILLGAISLVMSALLSNWALQPIAVISTRLDQISQQELLEADVSSNSNERHDEISVVSQKIDRIGRKMRNVEEVFSALKENLDQILTNLQDGIVLFTQDGRAVLVSDSAARFMGLDRDKMFGGTVHEIFDRSTVLGRTIRQAFDVRISLMQEEVLTESGRRVQISLDFIHDEQAEDTPSALGALLTLHDAESMHQIEDELELSRRLAAIGRLTSGVGHEVKNPINAIVVHIELLRNKLTAGDPGTLRHIDIIRSEIQRLDRVVQTLVDFSRPVELQLREHDLREIVSSVLMLASAELEVSGISVETSVRTTGPVPGAILVKVDEDMIKQALLNVVLNAGHAMPSGGVIHVDLKEDGRNAVLAVGDQGTGIPPELIDKIFNLYFTTKPQGSGIGLAMTYRILQLHNGSIDVESAMGQGSTFTMRLPLSHPFDVRSRGVLPAELTVSRGETT